MFDYLWACLFDSMLKAGALLYFETCYELCWFLLPVLKGLI